MLKNYIWLNSTPDLRALETNNLSAKTPSITISTKKSKVAIKLKFTRTKILKCTNRVSMIPSKIIKTITKLVLDKKKLNKIKAHPIVPCFVSTVLKITKNNTKKK